MKKVLAVSALAALMAVSVLAKSQKWTGYVSDAKCGAKVDAACAKKCIEAGQKVVFVNDADKAVIPVANPETLKGHEGHHVLVEGKLDNNTLTVSKVHGAGRQEGEQLYLLTGKRHGFSRVIRDPDSSEPCDTR